MEGDIIAALVFQKKRWISSDPFFAMAIHASLELLIWLNESVGFHPTLSSPWQFPSKLGIAHLA
ncbi:MAG: hypothetical protein J5529_12490 [Prevotella sp.]|nr:hypothetical protein [Prevotella sp.]